MISPQGLLAEILPCLWLALDFRVWELEMVYVADKLGTIIGLDGRADKISTGREIYDSHLGRSGVTPRSAHISGFDSVLDGLGIILVRRLGQQALGGFT